MSGKSTYLRQVCQVPAFLQEGCWRMCEWMEMGMVRGGVSSSTLVPYTEFGTFITSHSHRHSGWILLQQLYRPLVQFWSSPHFGQYMI